MFSPLILSVYKPPLKGYQSSEYPVLAVPVRTHFTYWLAMKAAWSGLGTIINIEHDVQADDEHIRELINCPEPHCTFAYKIHKPHDVDFATHEVIGQATQDWYWCQYDWLERDGATRFESISEGTTHSVHSGLGFCKISTHGRRTVLDKVPWYTVESEVNKNIPRWHIHWPAVQHWHK